MMSKSTGLLDLCTEVAPACLVDASHGLFCKKELYGKQWNAWNPWNFMEFHGMHGNHGIHGIHGIHFWKRVFGKPHLEKRFLGKACWKVAFGKPLLENHVWMTVLFRRSCLENCFGKLFLWKTAFGKYQTNVKNDQQSARND